MKKWACFIVVFFIGYAFAKAQSRESLEKKKQEIQQQINQFDRLLREVRKEEENILLLVQTIEQKIDKTQQVINLTNQQANLITRSIKENTAKIKALESEVAELKKEYAAMIVKSYKKTNERSRLMFLLSSDDFLQAYKRIQYLNAYADYRKKQALEIQEKAALIVEKNEELEEEKKEKNAILASNRKQKKQLEADKKEQQALVDTAKKDEEKYRKQLAAKTQERSQVVAQIKKLIAADIAKSNEGKKNTSSTKFFLTPEGKALANNFKGSRGSLPWPVEEGFVSMKYGNQRSPIVPTATITSNGWRFQAPADAVARSIFDGEVVSITRKKNGILAVYVRHGNFTTIYENLKTVSVEKGDKVNTKSPLGIVFTDRSGVTELRFILMEDLNIVDPARWLAKG
jgi:septal ring factor EnvC (AmiA/AmiB activator)